VTAPGGRKGRRPERVFLDANVIRGQLTTDILMSLAAKKAIDPRWSHKVIDEARRHRPDGVSEEEINYRFRAMNRAIPEGVVIGFEHRMPAMRVRDENDRHVLAAAVHSNCATLVTQNDRDFDPPESGRNHISVERLSVFLTRKLDEEPRRTLAGLRSMVERNTRSPRTMPELIDTMARQEALHAFARELNHRVPPDQRGTVFSKAMAVALDALNPVRRKSNARGHDRPRQLLSSRDSSRDIER